MLETVDAGRPLRRAGLTVFPLVATADRELPYRLLRDAIEAGEVEITEMGSGNVGEVVARNSGPRDVLVLDGEQLVGAKQNRTTSRTILLPARTDTTLPVSCMEQGRWHFRSGRFEHAPQHSPSAVRRKAREVEAERAAGAGAGDPAGFAPSELGRAQYAVWEEIDGIARTLDASSSTGDLGEAYRKWMGRLGELGDAFPLVDGQVGLAVFLGRRPLGMDLIGAGALYADLHEQLLRGYLLDMLREERREAGGRDDGSGGGARGDRDPAGRADALDLLIQVADAELTRVPTPGRGVYRVLSGGVVGGELDDPERAEDEGWRDGLVHLSAFAAGPARGR
jgi:hypothetical protein